MNKLVLSLSLFLCLTSTSLVAQCPASITQFPYQESFEQIALPGWTRFGQPGWAAFSGPTPDPATGPGAASDGLLYQAVDLTGGTGSSVLESPCFDLRGLNLPELTFDYHMFGPDVGRLLVQLS
ncbi:MAG: hypothetical protein AAFZ52_12140, partial [Bacteroidota bacterium]